jgi:DNA-binding MarR family transcriptional regulator
MTAAEPLSVAEETVWRAFARAMIVVPRALDADLIRGQGLSMAAYLVLMHLSEAPTRRLRMSELAVAASLSPSRMSRLVDELVERGWVVRERSEIDLRSSYAVLTDDGLERLVTAYPTHLESVRRNVIDHLAGLDLAAFAHALQQFAGGRSVVDDSVEECAEALEAAVEAAESTGADVRA